MMICDLFVPFIKSRPGKSHHDWLPRYALFTLGVALWLVYGILLGSVPIIIGNGITLALASVVLFLKLLHIREDGGGSR